MIFLWGLIGFLTLLSIAYAVYSWKQWKMNEKLEAEEPKEIKDLQLPSVAEAAKSSFLSALKGLLLALALSLALISSYGALYHYLGIIFLVIFVVWSFYDFWCAWRTRLQARVIQRRNSRKRSAK